MLASRIRPVETRSIRRLARIPRVARRTALAVTISIGLLLPGCFFDLPPLDLDAGVITVGGSAGTGGTGGAGAPNLAGQGGTGGGPLTECPAGFVDCDDNLANGCEGDFRLTQPDPSQLLQVLKQPTPVTLDGNDDDWRGIPLLDLRQPCADCTSDQDDMNRVALAGRFTVPQPSDLTAAFRFSWDANNFYFWYQAYDNEIIADTALKASYQDGVELFIGDDNDEPNQGMDHPLLFIASNGEREEINRDPPAIQVQTRTVGTHCFFIEAAMTFTYLSGQESPIVSGTAGTNYRFDVATNDHDANQTPNPPAVERQSQIFFRDPGKDYWFMSNGQLARLELVATTPSVESTP